MDRKKSILKRSDSKKRKSVKSLKLDIDNIEKETEQKQNRKSSTKDINKKADDSVSKQIENAKKDGKELSSGKKGKSEGEKVDSKRKKEIKANNKKQLAKLIAEDNAQLTGPDSGTETEDQQHGDFSDADNEEEQDPKEAPEPKDDVWDAELPDGYFQKEMNALLAEYKKAVANIDDLGSFSNESFSEVRGENDERFSMGLINKKMCYEGICEDEGMNWRYFNENDEEQAGFFNGYLGPHESLSFLRKMDENVATDSFEGPESYFLTVFESLAVSTIVEDVMEKLKILGDQYPGNNMKLEKSDFLTYEERFKTEVDEKELEFTPTLKNFKNPFIIDETQLGTHEQRLANKMQRDRLFLEEIMRTTKEEIDKYRSFESLKKTVAKEDGRLNEEITLMERKKKALAEVNQLREKITRCKKQTIADEYERIELVNHLKSQLFQAQQQGEKDVRYANNWYGSSNSHLMAVLDNEMTGENMKLKSVEIEMTRERLSHKNILCWYKLYFEELKNKVAFWMHKYEVDITGLDETISHTKETIKAQDTLVRGFENTIAARMKELGPYEAEKERQRVERIDNLRLFYMARKIQRWWRRHMKKHGLYKKKKKGNANKDEKDKKKKTKKK